MARPPPLVAEVAAKEEFVEEVAAASEDGASPGLVSRAGADERSSELRAPVAAPELAPSFSVVSADPLESSADVDAVPGVSAPASPAGDLLLASSASLVAPVACLLDDAPRAEDLATAPPRFRLGEGDLLEGQGVSLRADAPSAAPPSPEEFGELFEIAFGTEGIEAVLAAPEMPAARALEVRVGVSAAASAAAARLALEAPWLNRAEPVYPFRDHWGDCSVEEELAAAQELVAEPDLGPSAGGPPTFAELDVAEALDSKRARVS